jgi:hypothetical protein
MTILNTLKLVVYKPLNANNSAVVRRRKLRLVGLCRRLSSGRRIEVLRWYFNFRLMCAKIRLLSCNSNSDKLSC